MLVAARSGDGPLTLGVAGAVVLGALASLQPVAIKLPPKRTGTNQSILYMLSLLLLAKRPNGRHAKSFGFAVLEIKARAKSGSEQKIIYIIALTLELNGSTDVCRIKPYDR
jgi:hypothetical protein